MTGIRATTKRRLEALENRARLAPMINLWLDNGDGTITNLATGETIAAGALGLAMIRLRWPEDNTDYDENNTTAPG